MTTAESVSPACSDTTDQPNDMADTVRVDLQSSSDASLVVAMARYRHDALAEVYRRHAGAVLALAKRLLGRQGQAEEIVQEVFLRLWNHPDRFDAERGSLRSFLLAQTHSRSVDVIRSDSSRRLREERDQRERGPASLDLDRELWDLALAENVKSAMRRLSEGEREAIELAYFGGRTYREVAVMLDQPEGTVKSRIRSGLQRLRAELVASGVATAGGTW
jgi:RNA polymerase sigma-70 factor, ECF subfamily